MERIDSSEQSWTFTVIRSKGLHLLRPERSWRPIVCITVENKNRARSGIEWSTTTFETVLGLDGQNPNQKEIFVIGPNASSTTKFSVQVFYQPPGKKKAKRTKRIPVACCSCLLGEVVAKQESQKEKKHAQLKLQAQPSSKRSEKKNGADCRQAVLYVRVNQPSMYQPIRERVVSDDEYGYASSHHPDTTDYTSSEPPSSPIDPIPISIPIPTITTTTGTDVEGQKRLRKRKKVRGFCMNSDDEDGMISITCSEYESEGEGGSDAAGYDSSLDEAINWDEDEDPDDISGTLDDIRCLAKGVLEHEGQSKRLLETTGEDAQLWINALQVLGKCPGIASRLRSSSLKMMLRLSQRSGLCPQCLLIDNVEKLGDYPVAGGGFGDVWKGKIGDQIVCLKIVKHYLSSDVQKHLKEFVKEAIVWQQLEHPNLLPFMGMFYLNESRTQLCLVSPWMEQGNLEGFLKSTPSEHVDHYSLVYDVASGLAYLHDMKIVHSDLKAINILVTPDERACIGDFGLSRVADSHAIKFSSSAAGHSKGTLRWLSPELLSQDPPCSSSTFSDIYAFACVCYEIFTGKVPFYELNDGAVIVALLYHRKHPSRPDLTLLSDRIWNIMVDCWKYDSHLRPAASEVLARLEGLESPKTGNEIRPAPEWDVTKLSQIWKDVQYPALDVQKLVRLRKNLES